MQRPKIRRKSDLMKRVTSSLLIGRMCGNTSAGRFDNKKNDNIMRTFVQHEPHEFAWVVKVEDVVDCNARSRATRAQHGLLVLLTFGDEHRFSTGVRLLYTSLKRGYVHYSRYF